MVTAGNTHVARLPVCARASGMTATLVYGYFASIVRALRPVALAKASYKNGCCGSGGRADATRSAASRFGSIYQLVDRYSLRWFTYAFVCILMGHIHLATPMSHCEYCLGPIIVGRRFRPHAVGVSGHTCSRCKLKIYIYIYCVHNMNL